MNLVLERGYADLWISWSMNKAVFTVSLGFMHSKMNFICAKTVRK